MNELAVVDKGADWRRLKALVLDSVSSPITKRVYNLGLDEFFAWYAQEPRPGFTKATVAAWRVALPSQRAGRRFHQRSDYSGAGRGGRRQRTCWCRKLPTIALACLQRRAPRELAHRQAGSSNVFRRLN